MDVLSDALAVPRKLLYSYLRLLGLLLLIVYKLLFRCWENAKPALAPVINIYDTIDPDKVTVVSVLQQFVKIVMMLGILYYKVALAIWETVSRPFRKQLDAIKGLLLDINNDYSEVAKSEH